MMSPVWRFGDDDVDLDDRLEQDHAGRGSGLLQRERPRELEGHVGRVHAVELAVDERAPDVDHGVPLITPDCIVLTTPFSTEPMNVFGIAPRRSCRRTRTPRRGQGLDLDVADRVLTVATGLLHVSSDALARPRTVSRYAIFAGDVLTSTPNLRFIRSIWTSRWASPIPYITVSWVSSERSIRERRILLPQARQGCRQLVLVALGLGRDREREQRLRHLDRRQRHGVVLGRERVPGRRVRASRRPRCRPPVPESVSCSLPRSANSWPIRSSLPFVAR